MKGLQRLVWSEGMLLAPQHLQAWDRYQEALVAARVGVLAPVDWGILAVEIDPAALGAGQVRLVRFAGILPGGLPVAFDERDGGAPPPRTIAERFPPAARSLDVWLAVPRERDGVPTYAADAAAARARFATSSRQVPDAAGGASDVPVAFARPNATLLLGDEPREDFDAIRVARIVRGETGQPVLAPGFVPPVLRVAASPTLLAGLREVLARAVAKQRDLAETRRGRDATGDASGAELVRLLQLLVLNEHVPVLAHLAEAGDATPREAYLELTRLAGRLGTFAADADPTALPKLAHGDLQETFEPLLARLGQLLGALASAQFVAVPLEQRAGGLHLARFQDDRLLRGAQLFLVVKSELPEAQVVEALPRLCKIAAAAEIQALVQAAAPGLVVQVVHRPPSQLPLRPGASYFALATGDRHFAGIVAGRNMAIYLPPPFEPARTKVELLAIPAQDAARRG